jgi:23S rRNA U2552 (ribose-2'-O)-methylase RlmE/FtsJ
MTELKLFKSSDADEYFYDLNQNDLTTIHEHAEVLRKELLVWKNRIESERKWDIAKKYTNKYEFIFSLNHEGVADINPISRSYFKMIEILTDIKFHIDTPIKCACLCEGPGGFVQAINDYANLNGIKLEPISCISLVSMDKKVPNWKLDLTTNYKIEYGADGTGNLYRVENVDNFCKNTGFHTCDIVTADGGFDFSNDFNSQEKSFLRMFLAEMYTAVCVQKENGMCIIKSFDFFLKETISMVALLMKLYSNVDFYKPYTSRPANSEKYIICSGFRLDHLLINKIRVLFIRDDFNFENLLSESEYSRAHNIISLFNATFVKKQIINIQTTLKSIKTNQFIDENKIERHKYACIEWCRKYKVKIKKEYQNIHSL